MSGVVTDPLSARVAGAKVTLTRDGAQSAETVTGAQGEFAFNAVASDRYQIVVTATGFEPQSTAPFFVGAGRTTMDVSLQIGQLRQDVVVTACGERRSRSRRSARRSRSSIATRSTPLAKPDVLEALRIVPGADVVQTGARAASRRSSSAAALEFQQGADRRRTRQTTSAAPSTSPK